jgi:hypothetical protein
MRWEENIKIDFKQICFEEMLWMKLENRNNVSQIP